MDVLLAMLPDRATVGLSTLRCSRVPNPKRTVSKVKTPDGRDLPYGTELICRARSAPTVGSTVTIGDITGVAGAVAVFDTRGPWMRHARIYLTTRQDITGPLPADVTVYPSEETTDAYNTRIRRPSTDGLTMPGRVDPVSASEDHADGQRRAQAWTLTVDGDLIAQGVDAYATVEADGVTYQMTGDPLVHADPTGGTWSTATMRRTGPGTA